MEISMLTKEVNKKQDLNAVISKILNDSCLGQHSKSMVMLFVNQKSNHVYNKSEKALCQSLYYKNLGGYKHLRSLLDNKLPSARTLTRWHELRNFNIGIVKEVVAYLIKQRDKL